MFRTRFHVPFQRGVAAVELALVLPLIVLLLGGAIEAGRAVMVAHALQEAAQAGCRVYSVEGTTQSAASAIINTAMSQAGLTNHTVTFSPSSKAAIDVPMEPVSVTVTLSYANVAWVPTLFLSGSTLKGHSVMPADLDQSDGGDTNGYLDVNDDQEYDGNFRYEHRNGPSDDD